MSRPDPRSHRGILVAAASREWGCVDGNVWPPCRCAKCVVTHTGRRLARQYGQERAVDILEGRDERSGADLAAWNRLGSSKKVAA